MSIGTPSNADLLEIPPEPVRRFTVPEYHQMIKAGIIDEDDSVELLEGWLVPKMTRNAPHDLAVALLMTEFIRRLPPGWVPRIQSGLTTADSEPEPDVAVVRAPQRRYYKGHPGSRDAGMMVEVAESSLQRDRTTKQRIYARAAVPVYWIVNLLDIQIEAYTLPTKRAGLPRYRKRQDFKSGEEIPLILERKEIDRIPVRDLLP